MDLPPRTRVIPHEPYEPPGKGRELTADPARLMSPEEYLAFELAAETKHETTTAMCTR
jgi:hypothetical protein